MSIKKLLPEIKKNFLKLQNILCFSVITILLAFTVTAGLISYQRASDYVTEKVSFINLNTLYQNTNALRTDITQIKNISNYIKNNEEVLNSLRGFNEKTAHEKSAAYNSLWASLSFLFNLNPYITNISVFANDFNYSTSGPIAYSATSVSLEDILSSHLSDYLAKEDPGIIFFDADTSEYFDNKLKNIFKDTFLHGLMIKDGAEVLGCVFIFFDKKILDRLIDNNMTILDEQNYPLFGDPDLVQHSYSELLSKAASRLTYHGAMMHNINNDLYFEYDLAFNNWKVIYMQDKTTIRSRMTPVRNFYYITFFIMLFISVFISRKVSGIIIRPINDLIGATREYTAGTGYDQKRVRKRRLFSLQELILIYVFFIVMIPTMLFNALSFIYTSKVISNYIVEASKSSFDQTSDLLNIYFNQKINLARNIIYNNRIHGMLTDPEDPDDKIFYDLIHTNMRFYESSDAIRLFDIEGSLIHLNTSSHYRINISDGILERIKSDTRIFYLAGTAKDEHEKNVIDLYFKVKNLVSLDSFGFLSVRIQEGEINDVYRGLATNQIYVFIKDSSNKIISSQNKKDIDSVFTTADSKSSFVFSNELIIKDWSIIGIYDKSVFSADMYTLQLEKIYMTIIFLLISLILSYFLSLRLSSPIQSFKTKLGQTGIDNAEIYFPTNSMIAEINELGGSFNEMTVRIEQLVDDLLIETKNRNNLEITKKNAEITALQSQIDPHFIYNTFESLNWIIKHGLKDDAIKMVSDLSELLRYSARFSEPLVSFLEELKCLRSYTDIMSIRFNNNLDFIWDIDPDILELKTLRFILQPILENSIYHGVLRGEKKGNITIEGSLKDGSVMFKIKDNGVGIEKNKLEELIESLKRNSKDHIGLYNVQTRLNLFFGEGHGIQIESDGKTYTQVTVFVPVIKQP